MMDYSNLPEPDLLTRTVEHRLFIPLLWAVCVAGWVLVAYLLASGQ
jgi:hypothetical protein